VVKILCKSRAWNDEIDKGIKKWFSDFSDWLMNSKIGKGAAKRLNNHATFYVAQLATYLEFSGRTGEARNLIKTFADTTFQNSILESGEQPMESKRTKPFHYQSFNLEALTYIALLSKNINGINLWETKTKYGTTIQNAIDYMISLAGRGVGEEDITTLLPALYKSRDHYGDESGRYTNEINKILKKTNGASEWWTVYSPKSVSDNNPCCLDMENSGAVLLGTSLYGFLSLSLGIFFAFLI